MMKVDDLKKVMLERKGEEEAKMRKSVGWKGEIKGTREKRKN
jgi:hypothetical protein